MKGIVIGEKMSLELYHFFKCFILFHSACRLGFRSWARYQSINQSINL